MLSLSDANNLYGVSERIVAVESLVFLGEQYKLLQSYMNTLLTLDTSNYSLQQFYNQVLIYLLFILILMYFVKYCLLFQNMVLYY